VRPGSHNQRNYNEYERLQDCGGAHRRGQCARKSSTHGEPSPGSTGSQGELECDGEGREYAKQLGCKARAHKQLQPAHTISLVP
jgi:hypothetical protein